MEDVLGSGVLVYLSTSWLAELYQQVVHCDLLHQAGYSDQAASLISLLTGNLYPQSHRQIWYRHF